MRNAKARRTAAQMHALAAVRREIGSGDSANGRKYLREFTRAFQRYDAVLSTQQLNEKITAADILLIGDYHALPASQRFAAKLVETGAQHCPVVLGLEAVLSRDQKILDAWWRREIPEDELRQRLRFDREWGYQWPPFYELLITAREHAEGIYGLDCMPREDLRRIRSRDRHAAAKTCEMREQHPNAAILVLFGESHMAPQHLPSVLQELLPAQSIVTVLQNVDALYWQAVGEEAAAVSIGDDAVCVFNSSPLEKYESYRLCFERWNAAADDLPDFAPAVYNLILSDSVSGAVFRVPSRLPAERHPAQVFSRLSAGSGLRARWRDCERTGGSADRGPRVFICAGDEHVLHSRVSDGCCGGRGDAVPAFRLPGNGENLSAC